MQNYGFNYGGYNPYLPHGNYQQMQQQSTPNFKLYPISKESDINSIVADFSGSPLYFHNQSNDEIYIKQFDIKTGLTNLKKYKPLEGSLSQVNKEDNINPYEKDFKSINDRLDELKELIKPVEKEAKK